MKTSVYIIIAILLTACGNTKTYTEGDNQAFQNLKDMVMARNFEIQSNFARPMATATFMQVANSNILGPGNTANQIDISSIFNNLTVKGDTISGYFPYYGEQQFGGGYPGMNHQGIEFKDVPRDYKVTVNDNKRSIKINYRIGDQYRGKEQYNVFMTLFPNKRSSIQINSTNRTPIEFTGNVKILDTEEKIQ